MPAVLDHIFVLVFAVLFPASGYLLYRRTLAVLKARKGSRRHAYLRTTITQWMLAGIGLGIWWSAGRDWPDLGLGLAPGRGMWTATAITTIGLAILVAQLRAVWKADDDTLGRSYAALGDLAWLLPHNHSEIKAFDILSVTAGIVEELLWRGFLLWYLGHYLPLWGAGLVAVGLFGLAHAYQGVGGIVKTSAAGLIAVALFVLSGSLWLPMLLHAATDLLQGRVAAHIIACGSDEALDLPRYERQIQS